MENDKLVRMSDVERWILTESACIDTPADRDAVVERMRYSIPAVDAVEVVRCGKCEFRYYAPDGSGHCRKKLGDWFTDDGFCSDGLPKEGDGDGDV
jgi:hypothetical protein